MELWEKLASCVNPRLVRIVVIIVDSQAVLEYVAYEDVV